MGNTIRIIGSNSTIAMPLWVRKELNIAPTSAIIFTPINGMILLTKGGDLDLIDYSDDIDTVCIPEKILKTVKLSPFDLVDIIKIDGDVYLTKHEISNPKCIICGSEKDIIDFNSAALCSDCFSKDEQFMISERYGDYKPMSTMIRDYKLVDAGVVGFLRKIDSRNRISVPADFMRMLNLHSGDTCTISYDSGEIRIKKHKQMDDNFRNGVLFTPIVGIDMCQSKECIKNAITETANVCELHSCDLTASKLTCNMVYAHQIAADLLGGESSNE